MLPIRSDDALVPGRECASTVAGRYQSFGEGVVVSRTLFDPSGEVPVIPAPVLLAGLTEVPQRHVPIA